MPRHPRSPTRSAPFVGTSAEDGKEIICYCIFTRYIVMAQRKPGCRGQEVKKSDVILSQKVSSDKKRFESFISAFSARQL